MSSFKSSENIQKQECGPDILSEVFTSHPRNINTTRLFFISPRTLIQPCLEEIGLVDMMLEFFLVKVIDKYNLTTVASLLVNVQIL